MKYNFRRNTKTIEEIYRDFDSGKLFVDQSYQRRKVWNDQDKTRLIETILLELVMPEVFFWTTDRDPETGLASIHIVDGQQRITSIVEFISGEFLLNEKFLLSDKIKGSCGRKYFAELEKMYKGILWGYPISIVEIDTSCTKADIRDMFYRLNLTNYNLNPQEKRNSFDSAFGEKSESLSTLDFWKKMRVFSSNDAKRMKDVEYCCSIYILANEGIVDQTNGKKINDYYDDYKDEFDNNNKLLSKIFEAMEMINRLTDKTTISFVSKKAQMYTMFCIAFKMIDQGIDISDGIFEKFKMFVDTYSKFRNEFTLEYSDPNLFALYENIKKYKLASSEGINKVANRMIRFEALYKICIESGGECVNLLQEISDNFSDKLEGRKKQYDKLEDDDLVDIEEL